MTPDEIEALLASPETTLAEELAKEDQYLLHQLVQHRKQRGLSQADVAERMGVTQSAVSQFERLGNDPRLSTVRRYARALGIMVRHKVDPEGCGETSASEELAHLTSAGISSAPTAAAAWATATPFVDHWSPVTDGGRQYVLSGVEAP